MRRVLPYFLRYRGRIALGGLFVLLSRLLMVQAPRYLGASLNALETAGPDSVEAARSASVLFLAASVGAGLFTYAMRLLIVGASRHVERDLKQDLFAKMQTLPVAWFDRNRTGDLLSRLTSDVEAVRFAFGPGVMYLASTAVLFPMALISMFDLSVPVTLVSLVPLLCVAVFVRGLAPGIMRRTRAVQDRIGDLSARAQESFAGARVVRAYATEPVEVGAFRGANDALVAETLGLARVRAWLTAGLYLLGGLAEVAVIGYGGWLAMERGVRLGDLGAFLGYMSMLVWPMISVGWVVSALQRSAAAVQRIDEVLGLESERPAPCPGEGGAPVVPDAFRGDLEVRGLTFSYPGAATPALSGVSLRVPAGSTLALVGPVGAGKSTLLRLLPRLYEPPCGTVLLDGVDVGSVPLPRLRGAFASVPQDAFLFSDTIRGNLEYATGAASETERLRLVVETAGLAPDLAAFPRGLETVVGERGVTLSGGQKQRASLARALLREAPVLLLDDAFSSVDTQTEERILAGLVVEMRRRTTILVAHRLSTVRHADRVVVLDAGRVVEQGTHDELVAAGGWYARTWTRQRLEAELEELE